MPQLRLRGIPMVTPFWRAGRSPNIYDPEHHYGFRYGKHHDELPHVVKFSGGRSSGMLLFALLKNKLLQRKRGDVVVFNNTGAEHPATYEFVARCKKITESRFKIPFFITEYQTYEDVHSGEWTRHPTYRLTNARPYEPDNPNGYRCNGEPFEEMLSWAGYVPNQFRRICTHSLKLETTRLFLLDWFANQTHISRQGHGEKGSRVDPDALYERHCRNRGAVPREIYLSKKDYVLNQCSPSRPEQVYQDFTLAPTGRRGPCVVAPAAQKFISFLGLRHDEQMRVQRIKAGRQRNEREEFEHIYMPLNDLRISKSDVLNFWGNQNWDLGLDDNTNLSNCVYCFLKGSAALRRVHDHMTNTEAKLDGKTKPSTLDWWKNLEEKYRRDLEAEDRKPAKGNKYIGFYGTNGSLYSTLTAHNSDNLLPDANILPCHCTD